MQEIIKEYGPALIAVVAIISLIALIMFLIGSDSNSVVGSAFTNLINDFFEKAATGSLKAAAEAAENINPGDI